MSDELGAHAAPTQDPETEFLLRSLDDLDRERADGNIDPETYERLRSDYTARAAAAVRAEADGSQIARDDEATTSLKHRVIVIGGMITFAVLSAIALAYGLGARLPGQTITGNAAGQANVSTASREKALVAATKARPDDAEAQLALARFRLGRQDLTGALTAYRAAATIDPSKAEPFAYTGWVIRLQGFPDQGLQLIDKAITLDGTYADARFFRGLILLRDQHDPEAAIPELQRYLVASPDSPLAAQVRQLLAEAVAAKDQEKK
jgi:cytochrome c-type biogenesis protein CcmH/NrfG